MTRNINEAFEELPEEDKLELKEISLILTSLLDKEDKNKPIKDKQIKKRLAKACLHLMKETPHDKIAMQETSYIISGFLFYNYGDDLNEIMEIAGILQLPEKNVPGNVETLWKNMKKMFEEYIQEN